MDNKRIVTLLGTVVIIIFAVTVGFFIWRYEKNIGSVLTQNHTTIQKQLSNIIPKPSSNYGNETTGWQTHKNFKNGFKIKYPEGWLIKEKLSMPPFFDAGFMIASPNPRIGCAVVINNNTKQLSLSEWVKEHKSQLSNTQMAFEILSQEQLTLNDKVSIKTKEKDTQGIESVVYYFSTGNKIFEVSYDIDYSDSNSSNIKLMETPQEYIKNYEKIVQSFDFLTDADKIQIPDNWKNYISEKYNYEIKYPEDWQLTQVEETYIALKIKKSSQSKSYLEIDAFPRNPKKLGILEFHKQNYGWGFLNEYLTTVNGVDGVRSQLDINHDSVSLAKDTLICDIDTNWSDNIDKDILEKMLNSFKFLD